MAGAEAEREGGFPPVENFEQTESEAVENEESRVIYDSDIGASSVDGLDVLANSESCVPGVDNHSNHCTDNGDVSVAELHQAEKSPVIDTGVKPAADTAQIYNFDTEKAKRLSPLGATLTSVSDTGVKGAQTPVSNPPLTQVSKRVKRTPIHLLDIERADSVGSGHGRSVRLRLRSPDPDSGKMSRYYTWVPNDEWEAFRSTFNWREAVNASRKIEARRQAIRRSVRSAGNAG